MPLLRLSGRIPSCLLTFDTIQQCGWMSSPFSFFVCVTNKMLSAEGKSLSFRRWRHESCYRGRMQLLPPFRWKQCCVKCLMVWGWQPVHRRGLTLPSVSPWPAAPGRQSEMWAGLLQRWRSLPLTASSLSSSFLNSTAIIPITAASSCGCCVFHTMVVFGTETKMQNS